MKSKPLNKAYKFTMLTATKIDKILELDIISEYKIVLIKYEMDKWRKK